MLVYIIMVIFSIAMLFVAEKFKDKKVIRIIAFILAGLSFFIVSAIRYDLGTDYIKRYAKDYIKLGSGKEVGNLELGYKLLVRFCLLFTKDYVILFVITSAIIIFLTFYRIYKESPYPIISVLVYFLMGYFFHSLNLMREYLAISILLFAYPFLIEKKYIRFGICAVIAALLHITSLIFLVALFMCRKNIFNLKWTIIISIILMITGKFLWKYIGIFIVQNLTRFSNYTKVTSQFSGGVFKKVEIVVNSTLFILQYYMYKNIPDKGRKENFFLNMQALSLFFMIFASAMSLFYRVSYYFAIFNIISIPYLLKKSNIEVKKKIVLVIAIFCTLMFQFTKKHILKNNDEVVPYKTIFTVEKRLKAK